VRVREMPVKRARQAATARRSRLVNGASGWEGTEARSVKFIMS
jgi:hypothetical protein